MKKFLLIPTRIGLICAMALMSAVFLVMPMIALACTGFQHVEIVNYDSGMTLLATGGQFSEGATDAGIVSQKTAAWAQTKRATTEICCNCHVGYYKIRNAVYEAPTVNSLNSDGFFLKARAYYMRV